MKFKMNQLFLEKRHSQDKRNAFLFGFIFKKSNPEWYLLKVLGSYPGILVRAISLLLRLIIMASERDRYSQIPEIESGVHYDIQYPY